MAACPSSLYMSSISLVLSDVNGSLGWLKVQQKDAADALSYLCPKEARSLIT
ncbi:MAG TPA: hypothetical protein VJP60_00640 [Rhizomicrobium sp.]|nr:hypothetical protein [Rhizomicrobium sp.]